MRTSTNRTTETGRTDTNDAVFATLVSEIRGLRADLAAANQRNLRAQLLLGRLQMQEQRIAYLDKQRADAAQRSADVQRAVAMMTAQVGDPDTAGCDGKKMPREMWPPARSHSRFPGWHDIRTMAIRRGPPPIHRLHGADRLNDLNVRRDAETP